MIPTSSATMNHSYVIGFYRREKDSLDRDTDNLTIASPPLLYIYGRELTFYLKSAFTVHRNHTIFTIAGANGKYKL